MIGVYVAIESGVGKGTSAAISSDCQGTAQKSGDSRGSALRPEIAVGDAMRAAGRDIIGAADRAPADPTLADAVCDIRKALKRWRLLPRLPGEQGEQLRHPARRMRDDRCAAGADRGNGQVKRRRTRRRVAFESPPAAGQATSGRNLGWSLKNASFSAQASSPHTCPARATIR